MKKFVFVLLLALSMSAFAIDKVRLDAFGDCYAEGQEIVYVMDVYSWAESNGYMQITKALIPSSDSYSHIWRDDGYHYFWIGSLQSFGQQYQQYIVVRQYVGD